MRFIIVFLFLGVFMSAKEFIEVKGVKIPIILEKSNLIPMSEVSIYVSGLGNLNAKNK